jgi:hypothetical protein
VIKAKKKATAICNGLFYKLGDTSTPKDRVLFQTIRF